MSADRRCTSQRRAHTSHVCTLLCLFQALLIASCLKTESSTSVARYNRCSVLIGQPHKCVQLYSSFFFNIVPGAATRFPHPHIHDKLYNRESINMVVLSQFIVCDGDVIIHTVKHKKKII